MDVVKSNDEFFKGLSEIEWDDAEAIGGLAHLLGNDLTKDAELRFVRAAIERQRANPAAKSGELLNAGLAALGKPPITPKRKLKSTLK
jgi:hypothetical protein